MSTTIGGVRIVDMPDLGAVTDDSSVVGEHAGSGRFGVPALRSYTINNRGLVTPYDFGAVGSTAAVWHDDTAALNNAFAQIGAAGGGRIYIPGIFYAAGALTVPDGVEIYGNFTPTGPIAGSSQTFFQKPGSKLILGTPGISLGTACILRNVMVIAASAPQTNPFGPAQCTTVIDAMRTSGTGVSLAGDSCLVADVQVLGFNYGVYCVGRVNRQLLRNVQGDCINGIHFDTGGDTSRIECAHFWPFLTGNDQSHGGAGYSGFQRPGVGIYSKASGDTLPIVQCTVFGWQTCFLCDSDSVSWVQCWADGNAPQSAGYATTGNCGSCQLVNSVAVANNFGVLHRPSNGAVFYISGGTSINAGGPPGGSTPATGLTACVVADGNGPVNCIGAYFNGGQVAFFLGANSKSSTLIGNMYDDVNQNWGNYYAVDAAVVPLLTKYGNRVINSPRNFRDTFPNNATTGTPLYDTMPNLITSLGLTGQLIVFATGATMQTPSVSWQVPGGGTNEKIWDIFATNTSFALRAVNDAFSAATNWISATRTGTTIGTIGLNGQAVAISGGVGFNGASPVLPKPTVSGAKGGNAALASLLTTLANYGLLTDSTTA